ncbi:MAG TPA: hypothetical protein VKA55_07990 [Gammaproteobacteria bacterium]|nr:hypothetical protein [Gammaproteobacteria bacterium]
MEAAAPTQPASGSPGTEIRRSLLWPLRPRPLAVIAAISALGLTTVIPVLGLVIAMGLAAAAIHTGFRALDHTGLRGRPDSEPLALRPDGDTVVRSVVLLLAGMAWGALALLIWTFGGILGGLAGGLLLAAMLPAVILCVGREHVLVTGLLEAVNPARLVAVMRDTGRPYAVTAAIPAGLAAITATAFLLLAGYLSLPVRLAGLYFLGTYTVLAAFRLAACLAAHHRQELGYVEARPRPAPPPPREAPEPTTEERVNALIKADRLQEAAELLRDQVMAHPTELQWWERYYRLLHHLGEDAPLLAASKGFLSALLRAGEEQRAMQVTHTALNRDRAFRPAKPEQVFQLARIARREGRPGLALRIMDGFARRCPDHADAPMVLLFSARIVGEDFRQPERAGELLDSLIRAYPEHPLAGEAKRLKQGFPEAS